ncbi:MAG: patatin-like phospholipase family protein [Syntrophothermus sp.]
MINEQPIRALILSGGGGRGAFHAGVYQYLMSENKANVDGFHSGPWKPDIVVGTSIGAVNGAAIAQGMAADELVNVWEHLEESDIQGIPPGMRGFARWTVHRLFGQLMKTDLPIVDPAISTSPAPSEYWPPLPFLPSWLAERVVGRWINLLDTGPLKQTLVSRFKFDEAKLAASETALLIAATQVQTGERVLFSNRSDQYPYYRRITRERILASCSIPLVYPWTQDPETKDLFWDGALVANTPLGAALDLMKGRDIDIPAEVVIVMMTPWLESEGRHPGRSYPTPKSFGDAITWILDWMLLSSFRVDLKMIDAFNEFAKLEREMGKPPFRYRMVNRVIVAPETFKEAERVIDYDGPVSAGLIAEGKAQAEKAFQKAFCR